MSALTIKLLGDPVLRAVCQPVSPINADTLKLLNDLADTLYAEPNRAGLAAPQVGVPLRLVVLDCGDGLIELINPEIILREGEQTGPEACLSLPGVYGKVKRASHVKVKTLNRAGQSVFIAGEGILARCLQHEIDHLDGVLYIDHVTEGQLFTVETGEPLKVSDLEAYVARG